MNILITGANGFIGRALCDKLLADGYQVRGAVRGQEKTEVGGLRSAVYAKLRRARDVRGRRSEDRGRRSKDSRLHAPAVLAHCRGRKLRRAREVGDHY